MSYVSPEDSRHLARLSASLNVMPWGILTVEVAPDLGRIVFGNHQAELYLTDNLFGRTFADMMGYFGVKEDLSGYITAKKISHYDFEKKTGSGPAWYRLHFIPHQDDRAFCLVVIENTTESKIMERQFFQAQRLESLGQLAGGVAHDFNNILSIIDGYTYMIKKIANGQPEIEGYVDRLAQAVQRGSALTGQLLTFGRHRSTSGSIVDLGQLICTQKSLIHPIMDASIHFTLDCEKDIYIEAQEDQICQILLNLCVNAREAMPDGGTLHIQTGIENGKAILRVKDSGCGMDEETKEKIFDPFFSTKEQGTGLGLSMVYGLVQDMKGSIDVMSVPGDGTVFTLQFPLSQKKPTVKADEDSSSQKEAELKGYTALIAEDEPDLLELVSGMVEDMGIHVLRAHNGSEAMVLQENYDGRIDFLLTDVVMPDLNGVKLAELFETARPSARVMFMSGYPEAGQMSRVTLPDGAFLVSKPVNFNKLGQVLQSMAKDQNNSLQKGGKSPTGQWKTA